MKKAIFILIACCIAAVGCSRRDRLLFSSLDAAIEKQDYYNLTHERLQDSLRTLYRSAQNDSARWEAAYGLEKIFFYHDIDSCYHAVSEMLILQGNDTRRRSISESCYANILYKMDSLRTALRVLQQIDTADICDEALNIYCFAGYHIYNRLQDENPEYRQLRDEMVERWYSSDSTRVEAVSYRNEILRTTGENDDAIRRLQECVLRTPNDTAKANYFIAKEYLYRGDTENAVRYFAVSAECDMRLGVKAYNALYELARILFRTGDIERADRYMRITLKDAFSSHYESRYDDVILSEMEIMNVLLEQQKQKRRAYFSTIIAITLLLSLAIVSLLVLTRYSSRLHESREKLAEVSKIKDNFLAIYMEKCVDYLNKVDEYRSSLRRTGKQDGPEAIIAMLRRPSFADGEFNNLLSGFDSAFLGIFPDFVDRVNDNMQPEYRLEMPSPGELSTELRILALIRMGINKRSKIAKVLNMSVTTIYSYHSNLKKRSLCREGFDRMIMNL